MHIAFAHPALLWALSLAAVPVILHLFNLQRPQVVWFSSIRFLKQIETESQKTSTIKRWLLLLMRVLAILFIVLAFAKPYIKNESITGQSNTGVKYIYIDNSFSMSNQTEKGSCLDHAKQIATSIITNGSKNERFWIADNDKIYASTEPTNKARSLEAISTISLSGTEKKLSEIVAKAKWKCGNDAFKLIVISDMQKISCNIAELQDSLTSTTIIPVIPTAAANISIDSCWFETPYRKSESQEKLFVKITKQNKNEQKDVSLRLFVNDSLRSVTNIAAEDGTTTHSLEYTNPKSGDVGIRLEIEDSPIEFDNTYRYAYSIATEIPVLQLFGQQPNAVIKAMYTGHSEIQYETKKTEQAAPSDFSQFSLIIAENRSALSEANSSALREFVTQGGSLMIIPTANQSNTKQKYLSETFGIVVDSVGKTADISHIQIAEELFATAVKNAKNELADIAVVSPHYFSIPANQRYRSLLTFANKQPAFVQIGYGQGKLYISAAPLERSNQAFIASPIIAPLLFNPALFSRPSHSNQTFIGQTAQVRIEGFDNGAVEINSIDGGVSFTPEYRYDRFNSTMVVMPSANIRTAGMYRLQTNDKSYPLAFNYGRKESDLSAFTESELENLISAGAKFSIETPQDNTDFQFAKLRTENRWIWIYFIILALACLLVEKLIIRYL